MSWDAPFESGRERLRGEGKRSDEKMQQRSEQCVMTKDQNTPHLWSIKQRNTVISSGEVDLNFKLKGSVPAFENCCA